MMQGDGSAIGGSGLTSRACVPSKQNVDDWSNTSLLNYWRIRDDLPYLIVLPAVVLPAVLPA
eukprot:6974056-Prymnesium_polylepis.2